jgi:hypothetical protein
MLKTNRTEVLMHQIYLNKPTWQFWIVFNYSLNLRQNIMNINIETIYKIEGIIFKF